MESIADNPSPLNVLFLTSSFPRFEGDFAGNFVYKFARGLSRLNCNIQVVAPDSPGTDINDDFGPIRVHRFRYFFPRSRQGIAYGGGIPGQLKSNPLRALQLPFFFLFFFLKACRYSKDADLIHSYWSFSAFVALGVSRLRRIPIVFRITGSDIFMTRIMGLRHLLLWTLRRGEIIICQNLHFKNTLMQLGIQETRIQIVSNGVDLEAFAPSDKESARKQLSLPLNKKIILSVGRLTPVKGYSTLIEAIPSVLKKNPELLFVIVGDGECKGELEHQRKAMGLLEHIHFAGFQNTATLPLWFNSADLFVMPSLSEGTPNSLLEAMACGLAVVSTPVGAIPEIVEEGKQGYFFETGSADQLAERITRLLNDPTLLAKLGVNALKRVHEQFGTWERQSARLKELYNRCVGTRTATPRHSRQG